MSIKGKKKKKIKKIKKCCRVEKIKENNKEELNLPDEDIHLQKS